MNQHERSSGNHDDDNNPSGLSVHPPPTSGFLPGQLPTTLSQISTGSQAENNHPQDTGIHEIGIHDPEQSHDVQSAPMHQRSQSRNTLPDPPHVRRSCTVLGCNSYAIMTMLLCLGVLAAVGQHCFYAYLNGRIIDDISIAQTWAIRVGIVFAFLFKTTLVAAVGISFSQGFWFFVRRRAILINAIDAIFGVLQNPLQFLAKDLFLKMKVLVILAGISWLLPLTAILSPGALTGCLMRNPTYISRYSPFSVYLEC